MIEIKNLKVLYPRFSIPFNDMSFKPHHITCVTGRNGVGKTTLFKAIAGLLPYEGEILYEGFATYHFQEPTLFNRTVKENILYPLKIRKWPMEQYLPTLENYVKILHVDHLLEMKAKELSSGEKMKVSLLRSIIFEPSILLLDEPTTYLDLASIDQLITLIKQLKQTMTILIITHNQAFIDALADDVVTLGENYVHR